MVLVLITGVAAVGLYRLYVPRHYPVPKLSVTGTSEQVARGQHLAFILCTGCHSLSGGRLPLSGGQDLIRSANLPPLRRFVPPDRTPGGPLSGWSNAQIARAVRDGVDPGGRVLPVMAAAGDGRYLSDADLAPLIAYLRHQSAVSKTTASESMSFLGLLMEGAGLLPRLPGVSRPRPDGRHRVGPPRSESDDGGAPAGVSGSLPRSWAALRIPWIGCGDWISWDSRPCTGGCMAYGQRANEEGGRTT